MTLQTLIGLWKISLRVSQFQVKVQYPQIIEGIVPVGGDRTAYSWQIHTRVNSRVQ